MYNGEIYCENIESAFDDFESAFEAVKFSKERLTRYFRTDDNEDIAYGLNDLTEAIDSAVKLLEIMKENIEDSFHQLEDEDKYDEDWDSFYDEGVRYVNRYGVPVYD